MLPALVAKIRLLRRVVQSWRFHPACLVSRKATKRRSFTKTRCWAMASSMPPSLIHLVHFGPLPLPSNTGALLPVIQFQLQSAFFIASSLERGLACFSFSYRLRRFSLRFYSERFVASGGGSRSIEAGSRGVACVSRGGIRVCCPAGFTHALSLYRTIVARVGGSRGHHQERRKE